MRDETDARLVMDVRDMFVSWWWQLVALETAISTPMGSAGTVARREHERPTHAGTNERISSQCSTAVRRAAAGARRSPARSTWFFSRLLLQHTGGSHGWRVAQLPTARDAAGLHRVHQATHVPPDIRSMGCSDAARSRIHLSPSTRTRARRVWFVSRSNRLEH